MVERVLFIMKMVKLDGTAKTLTDGQQLFVAKISNDLIGIATQRVGLGTTGGFDGVGNTSTTLFFTEVGIGNNHSFTTNYANITGDVTKRTVTVTTNTNHDLHSGHFVILMLIHHLQQRML